MKKTTCSICGSDNVLQSMGVYHCDNCGYLYRLRLSKDKKEKEVVMVAQISRNHAIHIYSLWEGISLSTISRGMQRFVA